MTNARDRETWEAINRKWPGGLDALGELVIAALAAAREEGIMSRAEWWEALVATYFAVFGAQPPEDMKACDMSHAIVDLHRQARTGGMEAARRICEGLAEDWRLRVPQERGWIRGAAECAGEIEADIRRAKEESR